MPLLEVNNLHVLLQTQRGPAEAVRGIGFTLERGETLGIVGESGCGKSITVQSLMGLLPSTAEVTGSIRFDGAELVGLPEREMCNIRGDRIGMIFQEPMTALNPLHTSRAPGGRALAPAPRALRRRCAQASRSPCSNVSAFLTPPRASMPIRTSSPAASVSASVSPWHWRASPTC